jgi:tetratricopeptide (TPR) repeat protein
LKRLLIALVVLTLAAVGLALSYQEAAKDRDYRSLLARGDTALRDDQTFGAIEAYSGAIALRPDSMLPYLRRGESYQRRGELESAARDFQSAAARDPTATRPLDELGDVRYLQQRFANAADTYERYLRLDDRAAQVGYKLALARYRDGNLDAALSALDAVLRLDERATDAYYLRGLCLRDRGELSAARKALEQAVAISPASIPMREELADVYASLGRRREELEQLQVIAGLDRDRLEPQIAVGLAHARWSADPQETPSRRAGHEDLAVLTLGSALERTPDHPLVYGALGRVWFDIAQARDDRAALNKALEALERAGSGSAATSEALTLYGRALLQIGRVDAAERVLQQATERYPIDPAAFLFYAMAAERERHPAAARQALIQLGALVEDDRGFVARAERIADLSLQLDDSATAVEWLQRANSVSDTDVRLLESLAVAQLRAGDQPGAAATIARGLEKDPDYGPLLELARRAGPNSASGPGRAGGPGGAGRAAGPRASDKTGAPER